MSAALLLAEMLDAEPDSAMARTGFGNLSAWQMKLILRDHSRRPAAARQEIVVKAMRAAKRGDLRPERVAAFLAACAAEGLEAEPSLPD